ncbi:MAG: type II toxin-antitoxin system Phd/YefM family antitoxin [Pseudomonadota bacterium]|nr:type II toxin-antitoxin system Phd/YefM family antitoxin [Pseudomonadota bacterium]
MEIVKASDFKATCLRLMDKVCQTGEQIIITKNGKPVSRLVPYRDVPKTIFGLHQQKVCSRDDLVTPLGVEWDVEL